MGALARRQHGLVTRAQALEAGLSPAAWGRRLNDGQLEPVFPGVARVVSSPRSDEQRALAAVLAVGRGAMGSHVTAARLWGADLPAELVDVTVRDRARSGRLPGIRLHRPRVLRDLRPVWLRGVPVTGPLRLAVDLGAVAPARQVAAVVDHLLVTRRLSLPALAAVADRHAGPGRRGVAVLRRLLDEWTVDHRHDSSFELQVLAMLADSGLPEPAFQYQVGRYRLDLAFPDARVAVEVDGWATHGSKAAFEADRARDLGLAARGWLVVRLTWWAVTNQPGRCCRQLHQVLAARSAA